MTNDKQLAVSAPVGGHRSSAVGQHVPVLLKEVIELLGPKPGEFIVDGTYGAGGHSAAILESVGPSGKLLALDWDPENVRKAGLQDPRFAIEHASYADLPELLSKKQIGKADGLLIDLGFSSGQLGNGRGFSFQKDEPLLMTYDPGRKPVKDLLKDLSVQWLEKIIREYGEERHAPKIAAAIKEALRRGPIETTGQLAAVIKNAAPSGYERGRINPATRTFQALRIYANGELENIGRVLEHLPEILKSGGRIAVISFHSLEDRIVKERFRELAKAGRVQLVTKKAIQASRAEALANPRSRSAKLRVARMI